MERVSLGWWAIFFLKLRLRYHLFFSAKNFMCKMCFLHVNYLEKIINFCVYNHVSAETVGETNVYRSRGKISGDIIYNICCSRCCIILQFWLKRNVCPSQEFFSFPLIHRLPTENSTKREGEEEHTSEVKADRCSLVTSQTIYGHKVRCHLFLDSSFTCTPLASTNGLFSVHKTWREIFNPV